MEDAVKRKGEIRAMKSKCTEAYTGMKHIQGIRHRADGWKSISGAISMAIALTVLTACGGIDRPDPAGSPENPGNSEAEVGAGSDEASQGAGLPDKEQAEISAADLHGGSSMELIQPYAEYMEILEQIRTEGRDPNGREYEWNVGWNFENNCFAILDVDNDGKQELLFNFNGSFIGAMCEVVYEYDMETDTLREELVEWVSTSYYSNGIVKAEMSHNHGRDPEGRGVWPYKVYQYDADKDSYQLLYTVDSWDGRVHEEDFPDGLDVNGDKLLYYVTVENADMAGSRSEDMPAGESGGTVGNASESRQPDVSDRNDNMMIFDWEEYNAWAEELTPEWCRIDVVYHHMTEDFVERVRSAYAQAAAYAAQADAWFVGREAGASCDYLLYDLDGDGSLELVTSINQGTGRYSDNHFYGLSDSGKVTELELVRLCNSKERDWNADFDIGGRTRIQAWQDNDGTIYYEGNDYMRYGIYGVYDEGGFYYLKDGVVYQDSIRGREQFFHEEDGQEDEVHYYNMEVDATGDTEEITEEQYEAIQEEYIKDMIETRVYQNWVYFQWEEITQGNISEEAICLKLFESALGSG